MKKTLFLVMLLSAAAHAQDFEGVMIWKIDMQITDPAAKAQYEEAQKRMNDPKQQAEMKEMMERMNDPQMKAMMEANPQMKAQLEKAMKMMQDGDLSSLVPKGYTVKIKNQNSLVSMEGGILANTDLLYLKEKDVTYKIDRESKTYSTINSTAGESDSKLETKVTKTNETTKILGYTCTKYIVDVKTENGNSMQQFLWTTSEIKGIDFKSMGKQRMGNSSQALYFDQVDGVPLKVEMAMQQGKMTMEATEVKRTSLSASDFAIPAGFKEVSL
jgi:hypothetical protein